MANVSFTDVTRFTATSSGTGSFVVSAAVTGYQTPLTAGASNFNYRYRAESADLSQWEVGTGAYTSSTATLTRTPIFNSAGGSSAINFTAPPQVAFVWLAEEMPATGQLLGTATNDSANSGYVGEYFSSNVLQGSAITLTSGSAANINSISLPAGDFDVWITGYFLPGVATTVQVLERCISSQSSTVNNTSPNFSQFASNNTIIGGNIVSVNVPPVRISLSASATYNDVAFASFASSNCTVFGGMFARRRR